MMPIIYILSLAGWNHLSRLTKYSSIVKLLLVSVALLGMIANLGFIVDNAYPMLATKLRRDPEVKSIEFFSQPFITPLYSDIHRNISIKFPAHTLLENPMPEEIFKSDPNAYYRRRMEDYKIEGYPTHILVQ